MPGPLPPRRRHADQTSAAAVSGQATAAVAGPAGGKAEAARDAAVGKVQTGATEEERASALGALLEAAQTLTLLTTDDVHARLRALVREKRLLGAVMLEGQRHGWIVPTAKHRNSTRTECHARPVRVWRSLCRDDRG
jgi:hypothetical protein